MTRTAKAKGTVKLKTADGKEYLAEEIILDENFHYSLAIPLLSALSNESKFSLKRNENGKVKRTVFDRTAFSPCNCNFDDGQSPQDLRSSGAEHNLLAQSVTHKNVGLKLFGLPNFYSSVLALRDSKAEPNIPNKGLQIQANCK